MPEKVKILKAVDNDTFKVQLKDGTIKSVRLVSDNNQAWYDGFEKGQPGFKLDRTVSSLIGKEVNVNFRKLTEEQYQSNSNRELGSISTKDIPDLAEHLFSKNQVYKRDIGKDWTLNIKEEPKDSLISPQQFKATQSLLIKKEQGLEPKKILAYQREISKVKQKFGFNTDKELVDFIGRRSVVPYESLKTFQTKTQLTPMETQTKTNILKVTPYNGKTKTYQKISVDEANALIDGDKIKGTNIDELKSQLEQTGAIKDLTHYELHQSNGTKYLFPVFKGNSSQQFNQALKTNEGDYLNAFGNKYATSDSAIKEWKDQFGVSAKYDNTQENKLKVDSGTPETDLQLPIKKDETVTLNQIGLPNRIDPNSKLSKVLKLLPSSIGSFNTPVNKSVQMVDGKKAIITKTGPESFSLKQTFFEDGTWSDGIKKGTWSLENNKVVINPTSLLKAKNQKEASLSKVAFPILGALLKNEAENAMDLTIGLALPETKLFGKLAKNPLAKETIKKGAGFKNIKVKPRLGTKTVYPPNYKPKIPKMDKDKLESWLNYEFKKGGILKFQNGQALPYNYQTDPLYDPQQVISNFTGVTNQSSQNPYASIGTNFMGGIRATPVTTKRFNLPPKYSALGNNNKINFTPNNYTANTPAIKLSEYNAPTGGYVKPAFPIANIKAIGNSFGNNYNYPEGSKDFSTMSDKPKAVTNNRTGFGYQEANLALSVLPMLLNTKVSADKLAYQPFNPAIRGIQGDPLLQQRLTSIAQNKYLQNKATSSDPSQELVRRLVVNRQAIQGNQEAYNIDTQARIADTQRYYSEKNAADQYNYTNKQNTDNQNVQMNNNAMMQNAAQKNQVTGQTIQNIMGYMTNKANDQNLVSQNYMAHKNIENQGVLNNITQKYASMYHSGLTDEQRNDLNFRYNQELSQARAKYNVNNVYSPYVNQLKKAGVYQYKKGGSISDETKVLSVITTKATNLDKLFIDSAKKYNELSSKVSTEALNRGSRLVVATLNNLSKSTLKSLPFKKIF
mgnify:CR=1 FL=1